MAEKPSPSDVNALYTPETLSVDWREVGRTLLKRSLPIAPLSTQPNEMAPEGEYGPLPVAAVVSDRSSLHHRDRAASPLNPIDDLLPIDRICEEEEFIDLLLTQPLPPSRKVALIGEGGTGKTILLQKLAYRLLERTDIVPIWISADALKGISIAEYVRDRWLSQKLYEGAPPRSALDASLERLLNSGRVWLFLDGMDRITLPEEAAETSLSVLAIAAKQIAHLPKSVGVVLSCRPKTWQADPVALSNAACYRTLELSDRYLVKQVLDRWFSPVKEAGGSTTIDSGFGEPLYHALQRSGREQVRAIVTTPLRLALICRFWQQQQLAELPTSRSQLYRGLVAEFYQWKAESIATLPSQQKELNAALAQWSLDAWEADAPIWVSASEQAPLLKLALQLGWLQPTGVSVANSDRWQYEFFDLTFQQYFAAEAIDDWQYFLDRSPSDSSIGGVYRLFEPRWRAVILFWLGRPDIDAASKEALIDAAIDFEDNCGYENFYGRRAFFLAAAGLAEFSESLACGRIVGQLLQWSFDPKTAEMPVAQDAKAALMETHRPTAVAAIVERLQSDSSEATFYALLKTLAAIAVDNAEAIAALEHLLERPASPGREWAIAETLGTIDEGNFLAIEIFTKRLAIGEGESIDPAVFQGLEKIGRGNVKAIAALLRCLQARASTGDRHRALACLETVARGNAMAIATFVQTIRTTADPGLRRQMAESLEKIDPGNPIASAVLIQLLDTDNEDLRRQVIYSLGELQPGNEAGIESLVKLLKTSQDSLTGWFAIGSLGKIGTSDSAAIDALAAIVKNADSPLLRKEAADALGKLDPANADAIAALLAMLKANGEEDLHREAADSLGKLDPGNPEAIEALAQLLQSTDDDFTRRQAASSLAKIDPGNLEAVATLIHLLQTASEPDLRSLAAESLGEVGSRNPAAIATLIRSLQASDDRETAKQAAKSLGAIAPGNREAIAACTRILTDSRDAGLRQQAADSLIQILSVKQMGEVIPPLRDRLARTPLGQGDLPIYQVLRYCSRHLPYPDFYRAWHRDRPASSRSASASSQAASGSSASAPATTLPALVSQAIQERSHLNGKLYPIFIDSCQFVDPNEPSLDIYEQMLAQGCPQFEHGLPETLPKLKLYWNLLQRNHPKSRFVLIFYENWQTNADRHLSGDLLEKVSKFGGAIAAVTDRSRGDIWHVSPQDPTLLTAIVDWMEAQLV